MRRGDFLGELKFNERWERLQTVRCKYTLRYSECPRNSVFSQSDDLELLKQVQEHTLKGLMTFIADEETGEIMNEVGPAKVCREGTLF